MRFNTARANLWTCSGLRSVRYAVTEKMGAAFVFLVPTLPSHWSQESHRCVHQEPLLDAWKNNSSNQINVVRNSSNILVLKICQDWCKIDHFVEINIKVNFFLDHPLCNEIVWNHEGVRWSYERGSGQWVVYQKIIIFSCATRVLPHAIHISPSNLRASYAR